MEDIRKRFQDLLKELFQFDCSDLDFGIYRIMNYKRDVLNQFIEKDLPAAISKELDSGQLANQSAAVEELKDLKTQILETLADNAIDAEGNLQSKYHGTKLGKQYLKLQSRTGGAQPKTALETAIYNHLYSFFSRYYDAADFMSLRRYSKKQKYAIPYNGEEVCLHWANKDQYYIKTGEYFRDYSFVTHGYTVHFKLRQADIPKDNLKGDKRFFLPFSKEIVIEEDKKQVIIPVEYRPLTDQESISYGSKNQQDKIIESALEAVQKALSKEDKILAALFAERRKTADDRSVSFLEHHLRKYTQINSSDFFIHKDLKGFLEQELDFYLKNEVLNLDELQAAGQHRAEGWFQIFCAIKSIGYTIIAFLSQLENFQKKLFEKKKFIYDTQYCITLDRVPEQLYTEIADNDAQWTEWKHLFAIDEEQKNLFTNGKNKKENRLAFLKTNPFLVIDTAFFDSDFIDQLLNSIADIDAQIDGLLINSENFQALNILQEKNRNDIKCMYIDPPYNTSASEILYKNEYKHSSWLSLLENRLSLGVALLSPNANLCITIDDFESHRLKMLITEMFGENSILGCASIRSNPSGRATPKGFSIAHEYALFVSLSNSAIVGRLPHTDKQISRYSEKDELGQYEWVNFRKHGGANAFRTARPAMYYPIFVKNADIRIPRIKWDDEKREWILEEKAKKGEKVIFPIRVVGDSSYEMTWKWGVDTARKQIHELCTRIDQRGEIGVYRKSRLREEGTLPRTWWDKTTYSATEYGTNLLADIIGTSNSFPFPKSIYATIDCLKVGGVDEDGIVIDFFAGSGTTGHAVINLNREDDGERKYILVEMGEYFDTVLKPRISKSVYSIQWRDGKPQRIPFYIRSQKKRISDLKKELDELKGIQEKQEYEFEAQRIKGEIDKCQFSINMAESQFREGNDYFGVSHCYKYIRLESYEDALNNIRFDESKGQQFMHFDRYLLDYMLDFETKDSQTFLNVKMLSNPFEYKLLIHQDGQTVECSVDLPETFNYLIGLHVQTRRVYKNGKTKYLVYKGNVDHKSVVVIWRTTENWQQKDYEADKKFISENKLTEGADEVYINGDSLIPNAQSLDPVFKKRMFTEVQYG